MVTTLRALLVRAALAFALPATELASQGDAPKKPKRNPELITRAEIEANSDVSSVQELIQRLRPRFLQTRGSGSIVNPAPVGPVVIVDDVRWSGSLNDLPPLTVYEIRYIKGTDASARYGVGFEGGAILIKTSRKS